MRMVLRVSDLLRPDSSENMMRLSEKPLQGTASICAFWRELAAATNFQRSNVKPQELGKAYIYIRQASTTAFEITRVAWLT